MEIHAYSELYIESAQNILGHMFDYAINEVGLEPNEFANRFVVSPISKEFEKGNPTYVAGKTGPEIAKLVLTGSGYSKSFPDEVMYIDRSPEYWAGWSLAYYQWLRNYHFMHILKAAPFSKILEMYPIYHEMDINQFVDRLDDILNTFYPQTPLRRYREIAGLSQSELSSISGVPLRQIQLFEQRQRDIRKAQSITVLMLSKALGCSMEDLM